MKGKGRKRCCEQTIIVCKPRLFLEEGMEKKESGTVRESVFPTKKKQNLKRSPRDRRLHILKNKQGGKPRQPDPRALPAICEPKKNLPSHDGKFRLKKKDPRENYG